VVVEPQRPDIRPPVEEAVVADLGAAEQRNLGWLRPGDVALTVMEELGDLGWPGKWVPGPQFRSYGILARGW
jgi:hypothetical protein